MKAKKNVIKILSVLLGAVLAFGACTDSERVNSDSNNSLQSSTQNSEIDVLNEYIVKEGRTDYKIVIGENANQMEAYAAQELMSFIYQATEVKLAIVRDKAIINDFSGKYLSVGKTVLSEESEIVVDVATYTMDGYKIVTEENTVILKGASGYGTLYAVYEFLEHTIDYHAYAVDELYFEKKENISLLDFDLTGIPDFEGRVVSFNHVFERGTATDAARMRMYAGWQGGYSIYDDRVWPIWSHTARVLIPKDEYPEYWQDSNGTQPCVTREEAVAVWIENLKKFIENNPGGVNFSIGLEDSASHCGCESCQQEANEHGGYGGVMMRFLNKLSDAITPWVEENFPGRVVNLIGLAYYSWDKAPTKTNEKGELVPYDESVIARDNVGVMYAPISACWKHALNDPTCTTNVSYATKMEGWRVLTKKLSIWSYCTNFHNYFINFNNWGSIQTNYQYYKESNVFFVFDQATEYSHSSLADLRIYLQSQLLWNVDQNVEELIDDFMFHYYKVAAPYIRKYYDLTRAHYESLAVQQVWNHLDCGAVGNRYSSTEWSYAYCTQAMACFDDAKRAVELSNLDEETKQKVLSRIDADSTAVRYLILENYSDKYLKTDYNAMVDKFSEICDANGIVSYREGIVPISDLITKWRKL